MKFPLSILICISGKWNQANILHSEKIQKFVFHTFHFLCFQYSHPRISRNHCSKHHISYFLFVIVKILHYLCLLPLLPGGLIHITKDDYFNTKFSLESSTPTKPEQAWMAYNPSLMTTILFSTITFT